MRLKGMVMELLQRRDHDGLERLVAENARAVQPLVGRLWDADPEIAGLAAAALGTVAEAHPELAEDLLRRAMWALNDESATNGAPMLAVIGEIGHRNPELVAPFISPMTSYLWDASLRRGILEALHRIAESAPELMTGVRGMLETLAPEIDNSGEREILDRLLAVIRECADGR